MLSDHDVDEIERGRRQKTGGPIVLKWVDLLLADRRERIRQLEHVRQRLDQAFRYLDGLVREAQRPRPSPPTPRSPAVCPKCGEGVLVHEDRQECGPLNR